MILRNFFRTIQSGWRVILIFTLAAWAISLAVSLQAVPQYRSVATFLIYPNANLTSSRDVVTSLDTLGGRSVGNTYLEIFNSARVYKDTIQKLKLDPASMNIYQVSAEVTTGSNIMLSVSGPDPQTAAFLANNIGQNGINYIKSIYQVFEIAFLDQASVPELPYSPDTLRDGGIAAVAGLLAGLLITIAKETVRAPLEALRMRSITDRVSGAFNQRHFLRLMEQEIVNHPDAPLSMALVELEGLEELVDALPETIHSTLMQKVTAILHNQLHGNDIVARWGKASFSILLPSTPLNAASRPLERVKVTLAAPITLEPTGDQILLSPGIGIACRVKDEPATLLVDHAQAALEKARASESKMAAYAEYDSRAREKQAGE